MKAHFTKIALIAALSAAGATTAFAHTDYSEGGYSEAGSAHWLSHVAKSRSQPTANQLAAYGYVASGAAGRVLNVDSGTKYINVARLETVQINVGGKSVTWKFDTFGTAPFPLSKIISGADGVTVYITADPASRGG
ncbi:MAG TPA: CzcE family metal-binding protein [Thermogutta sp.]|nr:CzcE family metal-binding protein [Thermogutta sp.]